MRIKKQTCVGCFVSMDERLLNHRDTCEDCAEKVFCEYCGDSIVKEKEGSYECENCDDLTYFQKC